MRIAFVVHTFFPHWQAGTEVYARSLARKATLNGHEAFLICYEPPPPESEHFEGIKAWDSDYDGLPVHRISFFKTYRYFHLQEYLNQLVEGHLIQYFSTLRPDIVHVVHAMHLSTASVWAAKKLGLPVVATATDFWYVCPTYQLVKHDESLCRGPLSLSCLACITAAPKGSRLDRLVRYPVVSQVLSALLVLFAKLQLFTLEVSALLVWLSNRPAWMRMTLAQVDILLAPTPNTARLLSENGVVALSMRTCGFGLESPPQPKRERKSDSVLRIGYVGTFRQSKGVHVLLEAMRQLPPDRIRLDIYGKVGHFPEYDRQLFELAKGLDHVAFRGTFPNESLPDVFATLDVIVIPALWYENSPLVLLSAFAQKVPVVASRVGSLADLVVHGKNGLLFEMGKPESLAKQLRRIIDDSELVQRLRAGIPTVKTVDENIAELFEIYTQLYAKYKSSRPAPPKMPRYLSRIALARGALSKRMRLARSGVQFASNLALLHCRASVTPGKLSFEFEWHAHEIPSEWAVFVHLVDAEGNIRLQADHALSQYMQSPWGFIQYCFHRGIPPAEFGNTYQVKLGVWEPGTAFRLPILYSKGFHKIPVESAVVLGSIQLS
jgi:glycosyltransferase involved in cell wall biosynthesis